MVVVLAGGTEGESRELVEVAGVTFVEFVGVINGFSWPKKFEKEVLGSAFVVVAVGVTVGWGNVTSKKLKSEFGVEEEVGVVDLVDVDSVVVGVVGVLGVGGFSTFVVVVPIESELDILKCKIDIPLGDTLDVDSLLGKDKGGTTVVVLVEGTWCFSSTMTGAGRSVTIFFELFFKIYSISL